MSGKSSLKRQIEKIEAMTPAGPSTVYREVTDPINEFGEINPVIEITKTRDGDFHQPMHLLTLDEIRRDPRLKGHPRLDEILEAQARYIEQDEGYRETLHKAWGPELLNRAVLVKDHRGTHIEIPMDFDDVDEEANRELIDQLLFNVYEYGATPHEAAMLTSIQLMRRHYPELFKDAWDKAVEETAEELIKEDSEDEGLE